MPYIQQLDASHPVATDPVAEGAKEIREIKEALKDTFPYATGPLNVSNEALQAALQDIIPALEDSILALEARVAALENA
jgi:hypothetical protein